VNTFTDPVERASTVELNEKVFSALQALSPPERDILALRYGLRDGYTYPFEEICAALKFPLESAYHLEETGLQKLANCKTASALRELSREASWRRTAASPARLEVVPGVMEGV
jgi:DNA-directed RNA polymerase sigma subunit (sigma70/sigma32)